MNFKNSTVRTKLYSIVFVCIVAFVGFAVWSWNTLSVAKVHGPYYNRIVQGKDLIADILPPPNYIIESYLMALHIANEVDDGVSKDIMQKYVKRCKQLKSEFDDRHQYWIEDLPESEMKRIKTVDCFNPATKFYDVLENQFYPAALANDAKKVQELARGELRFHYEVHRAAIDKVVAMATERNAKDEKEIAEIVQTRMIWSSGSIIGIFFAIGFFGWFVARQTVTPLAGSANKLQDLSTVALADVSRQLRQNAESTSSQALLASNAAEQVSENASSLTTAVEQFEQSIKEIAGNASQAANVAKEGVDATEITSATITSLRESSSEIGNVIKVINSIAEQTNLLALNATIEAARAGDAGKGFAVVANEVKELAKETSRATENIVQQIESIQKGTDEAVSAIGQVSEVISKINESQNAIAGAVEEQTAMTSEISQNVFQVASQSSEIASSISKVAIAAKSTTEGSNETMQTAEDIESVANELLALVGACDSVGTKRRLESEKKEPTLQETVNE